MEYILRTIHVPTPGDHYSPATGSAIMTITYQLNRRHLQYGDASVVVLAPGTRRDYGEAEIVEAPLGPLPTPWQKAADAACGLLGGRRPFSERAYDGLDSSLDLGRGRLIVHNTAGPIRAIARRHPEAKICLYANNELFRTFSRREARRTIECCYRVICVSEFLADQLSRKLGGRPDQMRIVHNGADIEQFVPVDRSSHGAPLVLFVGRVVREKGAHLLIAAALAAQEQGRDFRLRIVGSSGFSSSESLTAYEEELRAAASPLGGKVEFVPFVDRAEIIKEYREASIFVVPSDWDDPCPLTLGEGMASGLPVIASRRGGMPEIGGDDAVLWFDSADMETLTSHLVGLIDDAERREALGRAARAQAESISWDTQYEHFRRAIL